MVKKIVIFFFHKMIFLFKIKCVLHSLLPVLLHHHWLSSAFPFHLNSFKQYRFANKIGETKHFHRNFYIIHAIIIVFSSSFDQIKVILESRINPYGILFQLFHHYCCLLCQFVCLFVCLSITFSFLIDDRAAALLPRHLPL